MDKELMHCPFCGGEPKMAEGTRDNSDEMLWFVMCRSCACEGAWATTVSGAIRGWNGRVDERAEAAEQRLEDHRGAWLLVRSELHKLDAELQVIRECNHEIENETDNLVVGHCVNEIMDALNRARAFTETMQESSEQMLNRPKPQV